MMERGCSFGIGPSVPDVLADSSHGRAAFRPPRQLARRPARADGDASSEHRIELDIRPPLIGDPAVSVTVIVPLAAGEAEPNDLLAALPRSFEIVLARGGTRASSMNEAARVARGRHLWFVHADTTLGVDAVAALLAGLAGAPSALHYFDLLFDGGPMMRLTEWGVCFRSRVLRLPFGDQALCIPAATFQKLGGYDETTACGEDLLLVRRAHRKRIAILPVGASIRTSARKYARHGWFRTTLRHLRLTVQLAIRAN